MLHTLLVCVLCLLIACSHENLEESGESAGMRISVPTGRVVSRLNLDDELPDDEALATCLEVAIQEHRKCSLPAGTLILTKYPAALRADSAQGAGNKDLMGAVLEGMGERTVIRGVSAKGFDVINLNRVKNFTIRNLTITAVKTSSDTTQGVNGISITNGSANIKVENVTVQNLPYVNKGNYFDGGKAFTVQPGTTPSASSTGISFVRCRSVNNPTGFGVDVNPNVIPSPGTITIAQSHVETAAMGLGISFSSKNEGGTALPGFNLTFERNKVSATRPLFIGRGYDINVSENDLKVTPSPFADVFPFTGHGLVALGVDTFRFERNNVTNDYSSTNVMLLGATNRAAHLQNVVFSENKLSGIAPIAIGYHAEANALVQPMTFTDNLFNRGHENLLDPRFLQ